MDFTLEIILLIAVAFAIGVVLGIVIKGRSLRRQASPLAASLLLPIEEEDAPPEAKETPAAPASVEPQPSVRVETQAEPPATAAPPTAPPPGAEHARGAYPGRPPQALDAPKGAADDLKLLRGIGPQNERKLHALGIFHLAQIAGWTPDEAQWIGAALGFPGRVEREDWVGQARALLGASTPPPADAPAEVEAPLFPELDATPAAHRPRRRR